MPMLRKDIPEELKWDLSGFFKSDAEKDALYHKIKERIPALAAWEKTPLTQKNAIEVLNLSSEISRGLEKLYVYVSLIRDQDTADPAAQSEKEKLEMLAVELSTASSFLSTAFTKLPTQTLKAMAADPAYVNHTVYLEEIIREKKHILSAKEEKLLGEIGAFTRDFRNIFSMLDNADMTFGKVQTPEGEVELSHGTYALLLQHADQKVRRDAFQTYYKSYTALLNTIAATYAGNVKKNCAVSKIRKYKGAMSRALFSEGVSDGVYKNLVSAVKKATPALHKYVALRKKALKLKELHMYDMHVPITADARLTMDYKDAYALVQEALKPLGKEYGKILKSAYDDRWLDVAETQGKRSGAYSWGCYDSNPVVLLNYQPTTHDVFTVAHEMGHAIHSYLSNRSQCYEKAGYTIFLAEIASTVNEVLLLKHLLKTAEGDMKKFLLSYYLDMFRTTLFRQTMFAEFEMFAHAEVEAGNPLTAASMSEHYLALNKAYYGAAAVHDEEIAHEWCRIPHFYNAFYVYKYATGLTAAVNIANRILKEGDAYKDKYLQFLSMGGSKMPLEILAVAEVDLTSKTPFAVAMDEFKATLAELKGLI